LYKVLTPSFVAFSPAQNIYQLIVHLCRHGFRQLRLAIRASATTDLSLLLLTWSMPFTGISSK
jgi:hypothetical protein